MNETPPPLRLWLVDDEPEYRSAMAFVLANAEGLRCERTFATGEDVLAALGEAGEAGPDVLLLDHHLPGLSGVDVLRRLRGEGRAVRAVMLTNTDDDGVIFEAFRAGASGYLLKNAPVQKILAAIGETAAGGMVMPPAVARLVLRLFEEPAAAPDYGLSAREREVLGWMVEGLTQPEIAGRLFVSASTVNGHVQRVYEKLHVHTSAAAVAKALRERLV